MNEKEFELLNLFYHLTKFNSETLPFTDYLEFISNKLELSVYSTLKLYTFLIDNSYIRNSYQERLYLTDKGMKKIMNYESDYEEQVVQL